MTQYSRFRAVDCKKFDPKHKYTLVISSIVALVFVIASIVTFQIVEEHREDAKHIFAINVTATNLTRSSTIGARLTDEECISNSFSSILPSCPGRSSRPTSDFRGRCVDRDDRCRYYRCPETGYHYDTQYTCDQRCYRSNCTKHRGFEAYTAVRCEFHSAVLTVKIGVVHEIMNDIRDINRGPSCDEFPFANYRIGSRFEMYYDPRDDSISFTDHADPGETLKIAYVILGFTIVIGLITIGLYINKWGSNCRSFAKKITIRQQSTRLDDETTIA